MTRPPRAAAAATFLLVLTVLTVLAGCTGSGSGPVSGRGSGTASSGGWTKAGIVDALPSPDSIPGVAGYADGGEPRTNRLLLLTAADPQKCGPEGATYARAGRPVIGAGASYLGSGPVPVLAVDVAGWASPARARAALASGKKLEACVDAPQQVTETTAGAVTVRKYRLAGADPARWFRAQLATGSLQETLQCSATAPADLKLCHRALTVATRKLAATKPH